MSKNNYSKLIETKFKSEALYFGINKVLVALSGGADSITTAFVIKKIGLELIALHCNFHLRNQESDHDMKFVDDFCRSLEIPLHTIDFDVKGYLKVNKGISIEMACRNLRHEWFENKLNETGYDRLVTGHNADDNIETFLLNIFRGSGTRGLKAMTNDNCKIWRPLLSFHRHEILNYINENKLKFVVDSTNLKSDYRRNYLRNEIIPSLKKEWNGLDSAIDKTISNIQAENKIVEYSLNAKLPDYGQPLSVHTVLNFPAPLLLIKRFIDPLEPFTTTPEEVLSAIFAKKPHIRKWRLKRGMLYLRNGNLSIEMGHGESCS